MAEESCPLPGALGASASHAASGPAAALAVKSFASLEEAAADVLATVADLLGMRTAFLTHTDVERGVLRVIASTNRDPAFVVPVGLELPLVQSP